LAAQIFFNDTSFLSNNVTVRDLISLDGDVHHIFPKQYLMDNHFDKTLYNQDANYVFLDRPINISVGKKAPKDYLQEAKTRFQEYDISGNIADSTKFYANLEANCVPPETLNMDYTSYEDFLEKRRGLMAAKIRQYYYAL
jgi:hypothetical protein